uniref:Uncharacterized protein n=1 Tax=Biomphalaria glabrata TaxID=6526 RepID=A0A2C9KXP3_BIOGL
MTDHPEYLSAEELRNRLYHSLRNRGFVDSIKSQLRNSLVTELQQTVHGPLTLKDLNIPEEGSLLHRASNSLVANHLSACQYEYTLSVFLPESGLSQDKKFEALDLLKLLNISPLSRLYQRLIAETHKDSKRGFLWQGVSEVSSLHANSINTVGCQTDLIKVGPITPLDEKLSDVDEMYASRREDYLRTGRAGAEERLLSFQRQLEDRYNTQLKMELARMKESEIATIKLSEKENSRKTLEQAKRDMERIYKDRYDALVIRERNTMERLQQQTEMQEREIYAQRQSILEEIEAVRQREVEVKREAEVNKREKRLSEERVKDKETELRRREMEIKQRESSFEQRLQNEMAQFKLDQQARFIERVQNVEVREQTLKEQERILSEEKFRLQQIKDELRDKTQRVNELETKLSECKYSEVNANKNNEYLNAKLRDMSDYSTLKEQVVLYRNELETLRTRLAEVLSMNERERGRQEELLRELRRPSPESLMLQRDLERAKESLRQEQIVFNQQKQVLEARLKEELDCNKDLMARFEEQTLQMKEMNREIVDLRQHLHMTTKALNNEVYRKAKEGLEQSQLVESRLSHKVHDSSRHSVDLNFDDHEPQRPSRFDADPKEIYHGVDFETFSQVRDGLYFEDDISSIDSADVIAQAKYRLKSLDQEAHNLEKAYHDFHCRITNIHAIPLDQPAQSPPRSRVVGQQQGAIVTSPAQSPIPFDNPRSSTPYKQKRKPQEIDDSFSELKTKPKLTADSQHPTLTSKITLDIDKGFVQNKHITVADLEQRPGSPPLMVIAGSVSSDEGLPKGTTLSALDQLEHHVTKTPAFTSAEQLEQVAKTSLVTVTHTESTSTRLMQPELVQPISLDTAWKSHAEDDVLEDVKRRQRELQEEEEEMERERQKLEEEQAREAVSTVTNKLDEEDNIDPVMKQYMAMVTQQKEKEKELAKKAVASWQQEEKTESQNASEELSAATDDKSEHDDDMSSW